MMMDGCIFCKIVKGEIPSEKIYEDEFVMAFMDISPANKGHALVIPKEHYETMLDIPEKLLEKVASGTKKVAGAMVDGLSVEGFNVLNNNKSVAGQVVDHLHFHIIPRFEGDGVDMSFPHTKYDEGEMKEYAEKIMKHIKD